MSSIIFSIKILILAVCYILSGGIFFKKYFREHKILVILSGIVAIVGSMYLGKDLCKDLGYCQENTFDFAISTSKTEPQNVWEPTDSLSLLPLSAEIKSTPFSSIFKFSFESVSFEAFKKQQAFQKKSMFETQKIYNARYAELHNSFQDYQQELTAYRLKFIETYNEAVLTGNPAYQVGIVTLTGYEAENNTLFVKLDWQADWIIDNIVTNPIKNATITISPNDAKALWQKGQEKRLFFKVTGFNNEKHYLSGQGVLVELEQGWFSDNRVWLINETLLGLSPTNKGKNGVKVMMDISEPVSVFVLALEFLSAWWWLIIVVIVVILLIGFEWKQRGRDQSLFLFNPLDHLCLLWWSLVMPQHLKAYKAVHDIGPIGKWLVSTLIWLPLLMPTLGLGFELLPHSNTALSANVYLIMCAGLGICWLLTGWLGDNDENLVVVLAVGLAVLLAVGLAVSLAGGLAVVLAVLLAGGLAVGQACGLAFGLAVSLAFGLAGGLASGLAGIVLAGVLAGVLVFGLAGGLVVIMEESLRTGTPSWIARFTFLLLIAAHLFLIYYCFLGGWRLFV